MFRYLILIQFLFFSERLYAELNPIQQMVREQVMQSGFEADLAEIAKHPFASPGNPIRASGAEGVYEYINKLSCPNSGRPFSRRTGSAGDGPYGFIIDSYMVGCHFSGTTDFYSIYIDLYHPETDTTRLELSDFATNIRHDLGSLVRGCVSGISSMILDVEVRKKKLQDSLMPFCNCIATEAGDSFWGQEITASAIGRVMNKSVADGKCALPDLQISQQ